MTGIIILVETAPLLNFQEIGIHQTNWRERFLELIREKQPISYDVDHMPNLAKDITRELKRNHYDHLILKSDQDRHFLVSR